MFTNDEIDMLCRGLDAIEKAESISGTMGDMLGAMFCRGDPHAEEKMASDREKRRQKEEEKFRKTRHQIILLKAKLVQMIGPQTDHTQVSFERR